MSTLEPRRLPKVWGWFPKLPIWSQLLVAAALGAVGALGQEPHNFALVLPLVMVMAFVMLRRQTHAGRAALTGWALGAGYFAVSLLWIVEPFQIDAARYGWMAPFALALLAGGLALFWGLAFWAARRLSRRAFPLVLTWTAAELLRAYLFTGFPWASPPQVLVSALAGQSLAWVGPHGAMLWMCLMAWALSYPAVYRGGTALRLGQTLLLIATVTLVMLPPARAPSALTETWVRLIQPNAPQKEKWQPDKIRMFYERQLALTAAPPAPAARAPDLVVWSETAIPWLLEAAPPALEQIAEAAGGTPVILGVQRREAGTLYNSLVLLDGQGGVAQTYDKHHIVPFGEYLPFGNLLGRFGLRGLAAADGNGYGRGPGARLLDLGALGTALPLICYEAVFAHDVNAAPSRPGMLIQITNDAWFGQTSGPQQHLAQARMRAIEQGLPMMRAANTGISAMIDPRGRIVQSLALGQAGYVDAALPAALPPTLYSRTGDTPLVIFLTIVLSAAALRAGRNRRRRTIRPPRRRAAGKGRKRRSSL
ncbi:apolipoprotein N-acyltransferase [Sulfitobacter sabulilitoris]|nr:apolipoprotein N-acyltransferase [Sulfitobacter sabulilitoris]